MNEILKKLLFNQEDNHILPFFWQHGEDEETLRHYMRIIHDSNIGAVCVESRPHPDFCGPKWWADMDAIIDEAKKLGMQVWILDDAHFPTGYANGALKDADSALLRQSLVVQYLDVPEEGIVLSLRDYEKAAPWQPSYIEGMMLQGGMGKKQEERGDDRLIAIAAIKEGGEDGKDLFALYSGAEESGGADGTVSFRKPDDGVWKIAILHITHDRGPHRDYINMMDMASCHKLIEAVYEPHFAHYGAEFGRTIAGFFSDEPEIGNGHLYEFEKKIGELDDQCWSSAVEKRLRDKWGADFERFLPLIWNQAFDKDLQARVRCDYMDAVTREVEADFSFQVGDWCRAHGVKYIGHLIEDGHQHLRTCSSLGHYFRGLAGQDWAGVDDIGGQVMPQGESVSMGGDFLHPVRDGEFWHYTLGKLCSSMAAIDPLKHGDGMCEIFGNYGWSEGVRLEKYLADHLMVRGINKYVPHAFTPKAFPDPDCPPHFYAHGHNPQYRHFGAIMKYMNRICTLITGGKAAVPVAMLYNAEADWAGDVMFLQKPAIRLYDSQIDYYFVPADIFTETEKYGTKTGKTLTVNGREFQAFLVPYMEYIPRAAALAALKLAEAGCPVLFADALPEATVEGGHGDALLEELRKAAGETLRAVQLDELVQYLTEKGIRDAVPCPESSRLRVLHFTKDAQAPDSASLEFYYAVNEAAERYEGVLTVPGIHQVSLYDAWENRVLPAEYEAGDGCTKVVIGLDPSKSVILLLNADTEAEPGTETAGAGVGTYGLSALSAKAADWSTGWRRSICRALEYPAFGPAREMDLPDRLAEEEPKFSGFVRYEKTLSLDTVPETAVLTISDAYEGVEVFVNGISLGIQVVPVFCYDLAKALKPGENTIAIEVATTLEREAQDFPNRFKEMGLPVPEVTVPSGINGTVSLALS